MMMPGNRYGVGRTMMTDGGERGGEEERKGALLS